MISVFKKVGLALLVLSCAAPTYAQVCMEKGAGASGKANMTCDNSYRDSLVACDAVLLPTDPKCTKNPPDPQCSVGTRPSCPPKPMPMIDTPNVSYEWAYSPYLWQYPRDKDDPSLPYDGTYALGTPGDTSRTFQLFGNTAPGTKRIAACTTQLVFPTNPSTVGGWAKVIRMQIDNCTNQYILNASMYPIQKESSKLVSMDDPTHPSNTISLASECQPLNTFTETANEYSASHYLEIAWKKTLQDPDYRASTQFAKCVPCVNAYGVSIDTQLCDHEPHLPCTPLGGPKTTIPAANQLAPPSPFPEVLLSSISKIQYENINDPSHPFSPRWDFLLTDRDYAADNVANLAAAAPDSAVATLINLGIRQYMNDDDAKTDIFCAGVRTADKESDAKKKADDLVPVDVLSFRKGAFEHALTNRLAYNNLCYNSPISAANVPSSTPEMLSPNPIPFITFAAMSWCWTLDSIEYIYPYTIYLHVHNEDCWKCYNLNGKVSDDGTNQHPPCTTQYLGKDLSMSNGSFPFPGGYNFFSLKANCQSDSMSSICATLRRPYTNLNVLKMRYYRTDDDDDTDQNNNSMKASGTIGGVGEGMTFKEYFGNHMPYPRIWDMGGVSLQMSPATDINSQAPLDTTGQYTAIVGIGREGVAKVASDALGTDADGKTAQDRHPDQRCLTGGWGTLVPLNDVGGVIVTTPDPLTSWTEMKLYQSRTLRQVGMSCLGRYEKVFKPGGAENMLLLRSGGMWQQLLVNKCTKGPHGTTTNCTDMTFKEYSDAGFPANDDTTIYIKNTETQNIPQPWRGYESSQTAANKFPFWGNGAPIVTLGLDNATPGDIIVMPWGPTTITNGPGLAKLAFVIETRLPNNTDCNTKKDCYVRVLEPDDGKWPDSCGTTDTWGEMKTRYYYKPGMLPVNAQKEYTRINSTSDCIETKISHCEQSGWSSLQVYHIRDDLRTGCQKKPNASGCEKDE